MTLEDACYPDLLRVIPDPPAKLYMRGELCDRPALAIVGTRHPTAYGRRMARRLAGECARAGIVVVSGLARGIDTAAHRATLEQGGITWAVMGSGLDRTYPPENAGLAAEIVAGGGAVLTEVPYGGAPLAHNFPRRNRIISGLSWGTVVVEGAYRSGSLITAKTALEQGRDVFAIPGPVDSNMSEAPLWLLRQGAILVRDLQDIVRELSPLQRAVPSGGPRVEEAALTVPPGGPRVEEAALTVPPGDPRVENAALTEADEKLLKLIGSDEKSLEELLLETAWDLPRMVGALTDLESKGIISALPGQLYGRS